MAGLVSTNIRKMRKPKILLETKRYGVSYEVNDSNPVLTRIYDSVGMVANVATDTNPNPLNDFDDVYPFRGIQEEVIEFSLTNKQTMIKIPKFYIRRELVGTTMEIAICEKRYDQSYVPHEMFLKGNVESFVVGTTEPTHAYNNYAYIGKYKTFSLEDAIYSPPYYNAFFPELTRAKSSPKLSIYPNQGQSIMDIVTWDGLQKLFMIVFATRDSKSIMPGNTSGTIQRSSINIGSSEKINCRQYSNTSMSFYGIRDLYGNAYEWIDGINFYNNEIYVCTDITKYADNTSSNYVRLNYGKPAESGYIIKLGFDNNNKFAQIPTDIGGSSTTYFTDYYDPSTTWCALFVGADHIANDKNGLFYMNTSYRETDEKIIGSRLIYRPLFV